MALPPLFRLRRPLNAFSSIVFPRAPYPTLNTQEFGTDILSLSLAFGSLYL